MYVCTGEHVRAFHVHFCWRFLLNKRRMCTKPLRCSVSSSNSNSDSDGSTSRNLEQSTINSSSAAAIDSCWSIKVAHIHTYKCIYICIAHIYSDAFKPLRSDCQPDWLQICLYVCVTNFFNDLFLVFNVTRF